MVDDCTMQRPERRSGALSWEMKVVAGSLLGMLLLVLVSSSSSSLLVKQLASSDLMSHDSNNSNDRRDLAGAAQEGERLQQDSRRTQESKDALSVLEQKLQPQSLYLDDEKTTTSGDVPSLRKHQFIHLHHMKTGGTSIDHYLKCVMNRLKKSGGGIQVKSHDDETPAADVEESAVTMITKDVSSKVKNTNIRPSQMPSVLQVPYSNIHECSRARYQRCKSKDDASCWNKVESAAFLSYCAPLFDLPVFGWEEATASSSSSFTATAQQDVDETQAAIQRPDATMGQRDITDVGTVDASRTSEISEDASASIIQEERVNAMTVLRNPVDRVWSMFRFQTKGCYKCTPLLEIYQAMETDMTAAVNTYGIQCLDQLHNHQVANLQSKQQDKQRRDEATVEGTARRLEGENDEQTMVPAAIANMKSFFTLIGVTEELPATIDMVGRVFPWANGTVEWSDLVCELTHDNASPKNNRCRPGNTHWDLPAHPDEETRAMILRYNSMDMQLYEAAVGHFELQKQVLLSGDDSN